MECLPNPSFSLDITSLPFPFNASVPLQCNPDIMWAGGILLGALALATFQCALAADNPPVQRTTALTAIYNIREHSNSKGGCAKYMPKLLTSYADALTLLSGAIQAMEDLRQSLPLKPPQGDVGPYNEWIRKAQMFLSMFGERVPEDGTLGPVGTDVLGMSWWCYQQDGSLHRWTADFLRSFDMDEIETFNPRKRSYEVLPEM